MAGMFPLPVKVEILINGSWTNITNYVYQRDGITITGGRADESSTSSPATCTMTVNNRDGRFSPNYTSGAYYPFLTRNVQLRVSINGATSSSGNSYSGYRFWGSVSTWPPLSDISGKDIYVPLTASGPLRQVNQGGGKGSALTRYYGGLTFSFAPIAYWPCEEDPSNSGLIGAGLSGGTNMTVTSGTPTWKAISNFNGSAPIGVVDGSTWDGLTGSFSSSGDDIYTTPGSYTWVASASTVNAKVWGAGGGGASQKGYSGGGGEFAQEATLAVTMGSSYPVIVGSAGSGGDNGTAGPNAGTAGVSSSFAGDSVTVTGHGGGGGTAGAAGAGGSGSTNTTHHPGGPGIGPGGGGGGSGGTAATGNTGTQTVSGGFYQGAAAVTGGGPGGNGWAGTVQDGSAPASGPGGGGGSGGAGGTGSPFGGGGGNGFAGKVELVYTPASVPTNNVLRWIQFVPKHGGNPNAVLLRMFTGGTIHQLDVIFISGGGLQLKGFNSVGGLLFTSSTLSIANGQTVMVSVELVPSGANMAWKMTAIIPGSTSLLGTVSGTQTTASIGNVSEVLVAPNGDVTKTAIGHISVQYALIALTAVSNALNGHDTEVGVDRFIRLANERALSNAVEFNEAADHWGFEASTQSWVATNGALTSSATTGTGWPSEGTKSLLLTANGAGNPTATSPTGLSGQPVNVGDIVSVAAEIFTPTALTKMFLGILWYTAAGAACAHAEDDTADTLMVANTATRFKLTATAPATAAFFAIKFGDHNTDANTTLMYLDNVRVHPQMGVQTRKEYKQFLEEIEDLDQGILKEAKDGWGLKYRTRIKLINQSPAVTLDYAQHMISPPFAPVVDDQKVKNDITVQRHKGSRIRVTLDTGTMSTLEPPGGTGRYKKQIKVVAQADAQLAALAQHLLTLGTVTDERYPTITVNLARASITANPLAPLMSAVAAVDIGDMVQVNNLPFWYPSSTVKQMIIGYTETINARPDTTTMGWQITWNCTPYTPYVQVASQLRRW